jgi:coenzyme F420 hydrogenase subunit beta
MQSMRTLHPSLPRRRSKLHTITEHVFGAEPQDPFVGNTQAIYTGYANDAQTRFNSASGGTITQLLIYALETGQIDGAIVTSMNQKNPLEPQAVIARTSDEIVAASRSKYCPTAANVGLKEALKTDGRYAIVGLPCHLHGVRKAQAASKLLEKRIVLQLGLLCSHTVDFSGVYLLLEKLGLKKEQVTSIAYRGQGWPGLLSVKTGDGAVVEVPLVGSWKAYWPMFAAFFFTPLRCTMCPDQAAELADISFGDAWLPELRNEKEGTSIVIARTNRGQQLLTQATEAGALTLQKVEAEKVLQSQFVNMKFKKNDLPSRLVLLRLSGKLTPQFMPKIQPRLSVVSLLRAGYVYLNIKASANRHFRGVLRRAPFPLIRLYYGLYKWLCII